MLVSAANKVIDAVDQWYAGSGDLGTTMARIASNDISTNVESWTDSVYEYSAR
ncbi:MAG: hypothetical protein KUG73_11505 [Pseudomonadales bacterium]|nr:hypothetical protein [Pseudomonadales bacterium]